MYPRHEIFIMDLLNWIAAELNLAVTFLCHQPYLGLPSEAEAILSLRLRIVVLAIVGVPTVLLWRCTWREGSSRKHLKTALKVLLIFLQNLMIRERHQTKLNLPIRIKQNKIMVTYAPPPHDGFPRNLAVTFKSSTISRIACLTGLRSPIWLSFPPSPSSSDTFTFVGYNQDKVSVQIDCKKLKPTSYRLQPTHQLDCN